MGLVAALAAVWLFIDRPWQRPFANPAEPPEEAPSRAVSGPDLAESAPATAAGLRAPNTFRAWEPLDESMVDPLPAYKEVVQGRTLVRLPALEEWPAGGELEFDVPLLGRVLVAVIESVEDDPWGNRNLVGLLREPDGREHRFVITLGARNQYAYFGTSRGSFELVASDGLGWLMPAANMDQHVDYSRPDYRIRERPRSR